MESLSQQKQALGEWEIKQIHNLILRKIAPEEGGRYRQLDIAHFQASPLRVCDPLKELAFAPVGDIIPLDGTRGRS